MGDYFISDHLAALQEMVGSGHSATADSESFLPQIIYAAERRSEFRARWSEALKYSPIAICIVDFDGWFLEVNPAACDLFQRPEQELQQLRWQDITHPDDIDGDDQKVDKIISGDVESYRMIKRYIMPDGSYKPAFLSVSACRAQRTGKRYFISQIIDLDWFGEIVDRARTRYAS